MRIDIFSDVVCPWCYIGKRRLEAALADFEHSDDVEVVWRSYQLDPTAEKNARVTTVEALGTKFPGGPEQVRQMLARTQQVAAEEGLEFGGSSWHANTVDAHRLLHLAHEVGGASLQGELKEALFRAHFTDNLNVDDPEVLVEVAGAVGLPVERVRQVLAGEEFVDAVRADIDQARAYGATGVPFFVVDGKYGVSGAQPKEAFAQVLERAWAEAHPALTVVDADGSEVCGPDGCAV